MLAGTIFLLAASLPLLGAGPEKIWRLGILAPSRRPDIYAAFLEELKKLGYAEGGNLVVVERNADGDYTRLPRLAEELVTARVDVIVTDATPGAVAAERAARTIPIVFNVGDPVLAGLVKSLSRPGGNATGTASMTTDVLLKQVELLREIVPRLDRVAMLMNPSNPSHVDHVRVVKVAAPIGGVVDVMSVEARSAQEIPKALDAAVEARAGAFLWIADPLLNQELRQIARLALERRLPSISINPRYTEYGGLMSYGADLEWLWRHLATYVDRIFHGANPGDLPVEQPTALPLMISRKTATKLGLAIPPELLLRADKVIE